MIKYKDKKSVGIRRTLGEWHNVSTLWKSREMLYDISFSNFALTVEKAADV